MTSYPVYIAARAFEFHNQMPPARTYFPRKYPARKRMGSKLSKNASAKDIAEMALKVAKSVARQRSSPAKYKYAQVAWGETGIVTSGNTVFNMVSIAQGDDVNTREGNAIRVRRLQVKGRFLSNSMATAPTWVRMLLFQDHRNDGTTPTVAELLQSDAFDAFQLIQPGNRKSFTILYDHVYAIADPAGVEPRVTHLVDIDLPLNTTVFYDGTAGGAPAENSIWGVMISTASTNGPELDSEYLVTFEDVQ